MYWHKGQYVPLYGIIISSMVIYFSKFQIFLQSSRMRSFDLPQFIVIQKTPIFDIIGVIGSA
jgi:hypothetical protein